ncbi:MAG: putative 2-dehydropantoate 2-reductase [Verrucomicrobia bacterium]|nr:putative 2-dehydropantoate 2-reductase [Verrucomicrobiota bacterium]
MDQRSYAIIGTGALGGFYGARLQKAGIETHFLLRSDFEHVCEHGLIVNSVEGDFVLPHVNAYARADDMPRCDVISVCLKATANDSLVDLLPALAAPHSTILLLQNGLGAEERIQRIVPGNRIVAGLCFLCSNKIGPGHITHLDYGNIALAEYRGDGKPAGTTEMMRAVGSDFEAAGISVKLNGDLVLARWMKLVWNIPFNGLSVALGCTTQEILQKPVWKDRAWKLMLEVQRGAAAVGRTIEGRFLEKMMTDTAKMIPYKTSMILDFEAGRPMEVEAIFGEPLRQAADASVELPMLRDLYEELATINRQWTTLK